MNLYELRRLEKAVLVPKFLHEKAMKLIMAHSAKNVKVL